jgi:membrane protein YqaA with SNARE-associated domain
VLLVSLTIGSVFGSIVNYSIDTLIYHHVTAPLSAKM